MENHQFRTQDTNLAAWLISQGFEFLDVEKGDNGCFIIFKNDNPKMDEFIRDFQLGRAEGNILTFCRARKKMITRIKIEEM